MSGERASVDGSSQPCDPASLFVMAGAWLTPEHRVCELVRSGRAMRRMKHGLRGSLFLVAGMLALVSLATAACGRVSYTPRPRDASAGDAARSDAGALDAGGFDAGQDGSAPTDSGARDAGVDSGATLDAGRDSGTDAGVDAGPAVCGALRLYYRFEESSGPVIDASGCGNDGTASAVTTGAAGRVGSAYRFNSVGVTTAHVLVPDSRSLSALRELTIEAWVRHIGGSFETIVGHGNLMDGDPFVFHTYSDRDPALSLGNNPVCTGVTSYRSSVPLSLDAWIHQAVTYDTATNLIVFYSGGVETHRETAPGVSGPICDGVEDMFVGASRPDGTWGWEGSIDELRLWGVVRTQAEICTDAGGVPGPGSSCALPR